ncbi:transposase [Nonomuraea sp. NPDC050786]|uniref:transposase n=1 Tax=Nonomuraea sp. NPDC050786 TaxID=3154840 RepID=UPI003403417A
MDGIRWRLRVGAPWRDVPECFGSWRAVYGLFVQDRHGRVAAGLRGVLVQGMLTVTFRVFIEMRELSTWPSLRQ